MSRILIAGCGYLGMALGQKLVASGHQVFGLCRGFRELPQGIHPIAADLTVPGDLSALPPEIEIVFYTAGAGRFDETIYRRTYLEGPRNLLRCLGERGKPPQHVFFTSSTAVHAQTDGAWVDESSPTEPRSLAGKILLEGEAAIQTAGLPATVIRLGGLYGPGRDRLVVEVREGRARLGSGPPRYTNRIHRDDAAGALQHLLDCPSLQPLYLAVDDEPADRNEVLRWLARTLGVPEPPLEAADARSARETTSKRCRNALLRASGFRFRHSSYREGYGALFGSSGTSS